MNRCHYCGTPIRGPWTYCNEDCENDCELADALSLENDL